MAIQTLSLDEASTVSGGRSNTIPIITPIASGHLVQFVLNGGFTSLGRLFRNKLISGAVESVGGFVNRLVSRH